MKLYTTGNGHWAGTQADARKVKKQEGIPCELYEVPVSKEDLLAFLNEKKVTTYRTPVEQPTSFKHPSPTPNTDLQMSAMRDVPEPVPIERGEEQLGSNESYIGKTTILVGGLVNKIHCYYYTEGRDM